MIRIGSLRVRVSEPNPRQQGLKLLRVDSGLGAAGGL